MSIFLVGGGPDALSTPFIWGQFLMEARDRAAAKTQDPTIVVVLFDHEGSAEHFLPAYSSPISVRLTQRWTTVLRDTGSELPCWFHRVSESKLPTDPAMTPTPAK
jgi:hypothetical protein